jgi:hypothetical protein
VSAGQDVARTLAALGRSEDGIGFWGSMLSAVARGVHERLLLTSIDLDHRAVDEVGERGGEVRDEVRDLLDLGDAPERDAAGRELVRLLM